MLILSKKFKEADSKPGKNEVNKLKRRVDCLERGNHLWRYYTEFGDSYRRCVHCDKNEELSREKYLDNIKKECQETIEKVENEIKQLEKNH